MHAAGKGASAVVIGGGLLGLEAARGLQLQGCDVTVVHLLDTLMNMQLDATGGAYLEPQDGADGRARAHLAEDRALLGNGHVEGVAFAGGEEVLDADLVVIAAGIRPNVELGRKAGLKVNRGIVVNDHMETSDPRIFAVGECVEHNGEVYGLVAPLFEQGKVLAATITGNKGPVFQGWKPAAKLKIMGVDVFSAGDFNETEGTEVVRYEDAAAGRLQEAAGARQPADGRGPGGRCRRQQSLHGLAAQRHRPRHAPPQSAVPGAEPRSRRIRRRDGRLRHRVRLHGRQQGRRSSRRSTKRASSTLAQLKECTRASTGCGSCSGTCQQILKAVAPDFEEETKKVLCKCVPFTQENLREIILSQRLKSVQQVLDIYGNGAGCEICKPALSYLVDVVWCGDHEEDRRRASSTIACTPTFRTTEPSPWCRAFAAA